MSDQNVTRLSSKRKAAREQRRAQSNYGQIRLNVTFEPSGKAYFRAYAKRPTDGWQEQQCFAQGVDVFGEYPPDFHAALAMFAEIAQGLRWLPSERG